MAAARPSHADAHDEQADEQHPAGARPVGDRAEVGRDEDRRHQLHDDDEAGRRRAAVGVGPDREREPDAPLGAVERQPRELDEQQRAVAEGQCRTPRAWISDDSRCLPPSGPLQVRARPYSTSSTRAGGEGHPCGRPVPGPAAAAPLARVCRSPTGGRGRRMRSDMGDERGVRDGHGWAVVPTAGHGAHAGDRAPDHRRPGRRDGSVRLATRGPGRLRGLDCGSASRRRLPSSAWRTRRFSTASSPT